MAATRTDDLRDTGYAIGWAVRRHWGLFLTEGIVAGVLLIGWPLAGTLSLMAVLIAFLFVEGPTSTAATA
jgi:hypothetical protein